MPRIRKTAKAYRKPPTVPTGRVVDVLTFNEQLRRAAEVGDIDDLVETLAHPRLLPAMVLWDQLRTAADDPDVLHVVNTMEKLMCPE